MNCTILNYMKYCTGILCMSDIGVFDVTTPWQWEPTEKIPYTEVATKSF